MCGVHAAAIHMHFHRRTSVVRNGLFFVYLIRNEVSQYERWVGLLPALHHKPTIIHDPCDFIAVLPAIENPTSIRVPQGFCFKINHHFDRLYFSSRQLNRIELKTNITPLKIDFIYIQCIWKITRFVFLFFNQLFVFYRSYIYMCVNFYR